ncbi:MAG: ABC transporter substrate-binding protein [Nitrososphaerales archaeon]
MTKKKELAVSTAVAIGLAVVLLVIGVAGGYLAGSAVPPVTSTITSTTTRTVTQPTTVTTTVAEGTAVTITQQTTLTTTATVTQPPITITTTVAAQTAKGLSGEIPIGIAYELSGGLADWGQMMRDAILLALDEVNRDLEALGLDFRFKPIVEDTQGTAEGAIKAVQSLVETKGVKVILGPLGSLGVKAAKSYVDSKQVVLISCCSTSLELALPDDYIFRTTATTDVQGKPIVEMLKSLGVKNIGLIYRGDAFGKSLADVIKKDFAAAGGTIGVEIPYTPDQPDYSAEVAKLSSEIRRMGVGPQTAVVAISFTEDGIPILDKARLDDTLGSVAWVGHNSWKSPSFLPPSAPAAIADFMVKVGFYASAPAASENTIYKAYVKNFEAKYGKKPFPQTEQAYDSAKLAVNAIILAGRYDGQAIKQALPKAAATTFGALGHLQLNEAGDLPLLVYDMSQLRKVGDTYQWVRIAILDPATGTLRKVG